MHPSSQDRFLELNETKETLVITPINGAIPNRGLAMPDINMHGLTYLQQISEASTGAGLHIEPGIWATVPHTTDPNEPASVVRMASIPHGTVILAQGVAQERRRIRSEEVDLEVGARKRAQRKHRFERSHAATRDNYACGVAL